MRERERSTRALSMNERCCLFLKIRNICACTECKREVRTGSEGGRDRERGRKRQGAREEETGSEGGRDRERGRKADKSTLGVRDRKREAGSERQEVRDAPRETRVERKREPEPACAGCDE